MQVCAICSKSVYAMDPQLNLDRTLLHKFCAKCEDCKCQITLANFVKLQTPDRLTILCKTHYFKRLREKVTSPESIKIEKKTDSDPANTTSGADDSFSQQPLSPEHTSVASPPAPKPLKCADWPVLTAVECVQRVTALPRWHLLETTTEDGVFLPKLVVSLETKDFVEALSLLNRAAAIAERLGHHPDLHLTGWNKVCIEVYTHSLGGLTALDFALVGAVDAEILADKDQPVKYSAKFLELHPEFSPLFAAETAPATEPAERTPPSKCSPDIGRQE